MMNRSLERVPVHGTDTPLLIPISEPYKLLEYPIDYIQTDDPTQMSEPFTKYKEASSI